MSVTKVFVGSLPSGTKPEELRHIFEGFGIVVECDVMNRCGFVHMENPEVADNAIASLNGMEFKGQKIVVEAGRPKEPRRSGPGSGRGGGRLSRDGEGRRGMQPTSMNRSRSPRGGRMDGFHSMGIRGRMPPRSTNTMGAGDGFQRGGNIGPMRSNFKVDRSTPYGRGGYSRFRDDGNSFDGSQRGGRFSNNLRDNFNTTLSGFGGGQSDSWERTNMNRGNFVKNYNDNIGLDGGMRRDRDMSGQDRRGFALSSGAQQDPQSYNGGYDASDRNSFPRRNTDRNMNGNMDRGGSRGGRGGFNNGMGGGRGGMSTRGGMGYKRGGMGNGNSTGNDRYFNEFPPLGNDGRGINRNAPRQNMMANRRY